MVCSHDVHDILGMNTKEHNFVYMYKKLRVFDSNRGK